MASNQMNYDYADVVAAFWNSKREYVCFRAKDDRDAKRMVEGLKRRVAKSAVSKSVEVHRFRRFVIMEKVV